MTNKIKDAIYTKRYVYNLHFSLNLVYKNTEIRLLQMKSYLTK